MSIGKKSIARAANAAAKAEAALEEPTPVTENKPAKAEEAPKTVAEKTTPEKFKNVRVGDKMPAFLL